MIRLILFVESGVGFGPNVLLCQQIKLQTIFLSDLYGTPRPDVLPDPERLRVCHPDVEGGRRTVTDHTHWDLGETVEVRGGETGHQTPKNKRRARTRKEGVGEPVEEVEEPKTSKTRRGVHPAVGTGR